MKRGFTLIEMMVAVTIFAIAIMVGVGALLSLVETNRRAQALNSVMQNLGAALESMTRSIRVGSNYHCQISSSPSNVTQATTECTNAPGHLIAFESSNGSASVDTDQVVYRLNNNKQIERSTNSGGTWVALTAPEVIIDSFDVYTLGPTVGDSFQPRVIMKIKGSAAVPGGTTQFTVQASVVQRLLDQ